MSYYTAVSILSWASLAVLGILVAENDRLPRKQKRVLYIAYIVVALAALAEWMGLYLNGNPDYSPWAIRVVKCADYILTPLVGGVIAMQFDSRTINSLFIGVLIEVNTVFQIVSLFTGWMIRVDSTNHYSHGPLYNAYMIMYLVLIFLVILEYFIYGQNYRRQNRVSLYASMITVIAGIMMQEMIGGGIRTAYLAITLGMALLFIHVTEFRQLESDDALQEQRFRILMSQIKPHFLYNTLGAIQAMCYTEPEEAAEATAKFSRYLRGNMDSLSNTELIPFAKELEHTRLYLDLEKMRFEDSLQIQFDIRHTDFMVPALTLQPIAENAVRHGARGKRQALGIVRISSFKDEDCSKIIVQDNGPGFDPEKVARANEEDVESHVGIGNVRERLKTMCGGSLDFESEPGKGTVAIIEIPDEFHKGTGMVRVRR